MAAFYDGTTFVQDDDCDADDFLLDETAVPDECFQGSLKRLYHTAFMYKGLIHTLGGIGTEGLPRKEFYRYNSEAKHWDPLAVSMSFPVPDSVVGCTPAVVTNYLYLICGARAEVPSEQEDCSNGIYVANLARDVIEFHAIELKNSIPFGFNRMSCQYGSDIFCFGGLTNDARTSEEFLMLNLAGSEWFALPEQRNTIYRASRSFGQLFLTSSSCIVVLGGHVERPKDQDIFSLDILPAYDIKTNRWFSMMSEGCYPEPRSHHTVTASNCGTYAILIGGRLNNREFSDEIFIAKFPRGSHLCMWTRYKRNLPFGLSHHSAMRMAPRRTSINPNIVMVFAGMLADGSLNGYIVSYDFKDLRRLFP